MTGVFLTGATGNAGHAISAELLARGYAVTAMVRTPTFLEGCRTVVGDLYDPHELADEVAAADAVIHLASPRNDTRDSVVRHDILGTGVLLDAWRKGNFIYSSSQTVYGIPQETLRETSPIDALCWYDLGKVCNEFQLKLAEPIFDRGAAVSFRMALLFSDSDRCDDRQFLSLVFQQCLNEATFVFDSEEGLETYGSSYVGPKDLGRAFVESLAIDQTDAYNVSSGFCTWRDLIETIDGYAGTRSNFVVRSGANANPGEFRLPQSRSFLDTSKFAIATNFSAEQSLEELVEGYVSWKSRQGVSIVDC